MTRDTAKKLVETAQALGFTELRMGRINLTPHGFAVFGKHPNGYRGRVAEGDLDDRRDQLAGLPSQYDYPPPAGVEKERAREGFA